MSAIPQSLEEAVASLQKILNHPRSLAVLRRLPRLEGRVLSSTTSPITRYGYELISKNRPKAQLCMRYIGPLRSTNGDLVIFTEAIRFHATPGFGVWERNAQLVRPIAITEISEDLEVMQRVVRIVVDMALCYYKEPDIPEYI